MLEKIQDFIYKVTWTVEMIAKRRNLGIKKILKLGGWL